MNTSAAIADGNQNHQLLNSFFVPRSWNGRSTLQTRLAVRSVNILLGTGVLFLGACPCPESNGIGTDVDGGASPQAPRACLDGLDFATNRHE